MLQPYGWVLATVTGLPDVGLGQRGAHVVVGDRHFGNVGRALVVDGAL